MVIKDNYYPLKVWSTTMIVAPILQVVFLTLYVGNEDSFFATLFAILAIMFFGALFSFPSFLLFYLTFLGLNSVLTSKILLKSLLILFCSALFFATLYLLNTWREFGGLNNRVLLLIIIYNACIIGSVFYYGRNKRLSLK